MNPHDIVQVETGRAGNYQHTAYGHKYFPFDPRPEDTCIESIAHHLSCQGRFNGATQHKEFEDRILYAVSEHSVIVSWYVETELNQPEYALEALLHDGSEFSIGDLIRPLKYSPEFKEPFTNVERRIEAVQAEAFGLRYPYPAAVKIADEAVAAAEYNQILVRDERLEWSSGRLHDDRNVAPYEIKMLQPYQAKMLFLRRFEELVTVREGYAELPERWHQYKLPMGSRALSSHEMYSQF